VYEREVVAMDAWDSGPTSRAIWIVNASLD
jgi:hypothetical protein